VVCSTTCCALHACKQDAVPTARHAAAGRCPVLNLLGTPAGGEVKLYLSAQNSRDSAVPYLETVKGVYNLMYVHCT
jgi:hypothetical protein